MVVLEVLGDDVDRIFHALADGTRRDILAQVIRAEQSVSALARQYPMSFAAVQKHVAVLERAALVVKRRRGREQVVGAEMAHWPGRPDSSTATSSSGAPYPRHRRDPVRRHHAGRGMNP